LVPDALQEVGVMKKWIIGIVVFVIVAAAAYVFIGRGGVNAATAQATPGVTDELPPVEAGNQVVADAVVVPVRSASLSLPSGGIVIELLVAEGDQVQAGQLLLRLDAARQAANVAQAEAQLHRAQSALAELQAGPRPQEIESAQAAVEAAQAQLARVQQTAQPEEIAAAQAGLAEAQASLQKVKEGPREQDLVAARADLANSEATLRQAQAAYDRVKGSPEIQMRPEALALEQATNSRNAAKARLEALQEGASAADIAAAYAQIQQAQAQLDLLQAPARSAEVAAATAEIRRAQAQLDLLAAGARPESVAGAEADVAAAEAALSQARAALAETELRAPWAGTVAALDAKVGEQVGPGSPVVVLADLTVWQIETDDLTELNVVRVREGDAVAITFDAIPDLELSGRVMRIKAIGENKMGDITYTAIIQPDQYDERLRWNMTASVIIEAQ
jgi:HlyD family secretion protein